MAPGRAPMYSTSGGQAVVIDSGPAGGGGPGVGLSELNVTARGTGTGPDGTVNCTYDAPVTGAHHYLCLSAQSGSAGLITYGAGGGAPELPLKINVNGSAYELWGAAAQRYIVADSTASAPSYARYIAYTSLTATRTITLAPAAVIPPGTAIVISDESGFASPTTSIRVVPAGADSINAAYEHYITSPYATLVLWSSGVDRYVTYP